MMSRRAEDGIPSTVPKLEMQPQANRRTSPRHETIEPTKMLPMADHDSEPVTREEMQKLFGRALRVR